MSDDRTLLRLYHFPLSPYCRKVRIMLREKGLAAELVEVHPWTGSDDLLTLNPAGEVPVLVDGDLVLPDSQAIVEYLEEAYPDSSLLGGNLAQRAETRRLMFWFDSKFARDVTDMLWREKLIKRLSRSGTPNSEALRLGAGSIRGHLDYISWLFESRRWLAGDDLSMADITAAAHLSVLDYLGDVPWASYPAARDWYAKIKSRPSFRPLLMDRLVGTKPPAHYDDLDF